MMNHSSRPSFDPKKFTKATAVDYSSSASESDDDLITPNTGHDDDEFGDFNPRKKRRLGGNNKERAALGIFGSDSEDDGPGKRWKRKNLRNQGMSFVTTTAARNNDSENNDSTDGEGDERPTMGLGKRNVEDEEEEEEEDGGEDEDVGVVLGFGKGTSGLGWGTNKPAQTKSHDEDTQMSIPKTKFDGKNALGRGFVPSSAYEPVLNETAIKNADKPKNTPQHSAFKSNGKINANSFGARMMAKMGYVEGTGLGKDGQGRNIVIEANLRPQGVGLGAVREKSEQERQEEKRQARLRGEVVVDSDEEEKKRKKKLKNKTIGSAFDSASSTPRRHKPKYLTAEELKASTPGLHIPEAFTPILDMTGPGGKMLISASGIMTPVSGISEIADVVQARKLVKRAQADLIAFSEEWRSLEERKSWIDLELKENEQELENLRSDFEQLSVFSNLVSEKLTAATEWSDVISCLKQAMELGSATSEIADIAVAALHPFIRDSDWDPLTEPDRFAADLRALSNLLNKSGNDSKAVGKQGAFSDSNGGIYRTHQKATTAYESMMYKNWLPQILAVVRSWDPTDPTPMLNIVESWEPLLPPFVRAQLIDNIARKLDTAISDWNPKKKRQNHHLPHTWLFPWLQYLPQYHLDPRGTGLVSDMKRKFRSLIDVWEFERGVVPGLAQWESILGDQWRPLIMSHVLPAMGQYLRRNFRVDPTDQEPYLPILTGMLKWNTLLESGMIAQVLVQNMFPMWNAKLEQWLALDEADLGEVAEWYAWWRGVVLKDYAATSADIRGELDKGLRAMNMA